MFISMKKAANGWSLTAGLAFLDILLVLDIWASAGLTEGGVRTLVRATARISVILFLAAFAASSLRTFWPNGFTTWLLRNRRYVGVGFAFAHFVHLLTLILFRNLYPVTWNEVVGLPLILLGSTGYVFIALMTATSFDRTTRWLGAKRWKRLHLTGGYFIWFIFAATYIPRAIKSLAFAPAALAVLLVLGLRIARWRRARKRARPLAQTSGHA